jgi:tetratricopeptide (TPR) repeat protein
MRSVSIVMRVVRSAIARALQRDYPAVDVTLQEVPGTVKRSTLGLLLNCYHIANIGVNPVAELPVLESRTCFLGGQAAVELGALGKKLARFGLYEADLQERVLTKSGTRVRLQDQPFQVLALLLERPGELVTRDEIQQKLWPADTYVAFDDGLNTAIKKLRLALGDSADNPRFVETVPRRGYRFLAPVTYHASVDQPELTKPPQNLPSDIVIAARERSRVVIERTSPKPILLWATVALVFALAAGVGAYFYGAGHRSRSEAQEREAASANSAIKPRPSVAVMGFRNLSREPEESWISTALSEMLNTELAAGERLRMVPGEEISRAKVDLSLTDTEALARESLARVRADIGADYVVLGSYTTLGQKGKKRIRLDLRLQDTRAGETIAEEAVGGSQDELFDLVSDAGTRLRQRLQAGGLAAEQTVQVRASLPSSVKAARLYAEGLSKLRVFEALAARDLLLKAVAADPTFPMAHSALASAWLALGYDSKAQQEAKLAYDLSAHLSPEERLLTEGRYREATRDWPKAVEIYDTLWRTFPDDLDYGLRLASVQSSAGQGKDALMTMAALRRLPFGVGADARIDLEESRSAEMMGDFRRSQQAAASAASKGRAQGARLIVAQARSDEGWDWDRLGEFDKAAEALTEAKSLFGAARDHRSTAVAINLIGDMLYDKGDVEAARTTLNESLSMCREYGFQKCAGRSLNAIGHIQKDQGHLQQALASYEEVLRINRETGVKAGVGAALSNIGNVLQALGDMPGARRKQEEALQVFTEIGDKRGMGATLGNLGNLLDDLGDLAGAVQCYERAYKIDEETGYKRGFGFVLSSWGLVLLEQDRLPEARAKLEDALRIRQEMGSPDMIGNSLLTLAHLTLEEGHPAEAAKLARDAASQLASVKSVEDEASANAVLARSMITQQRLSEARIAADQAIALSDKSSGFQPHLEAVLAAALLSAASGKTADADKQLEAVILQARKLSSPGYEFSARLELGKVQMKTGQSAAGNAQLTSLQRDAKAKGYLLIARNAAAALDPTNSKR